TLDDEKFGLGGVFLVAVGKLAGHPVGLQRAFAAHKVAGLLGRGAGAGRLGRFFKDCLRNGGVFLKIFGQRAVDKAGNQRLDVGIAELGLGLALKLGL